MRVALITDGISPYVLGGMQKHSFYLAKYFAQNKVHVDLVHYNDSLFDIDRLEFFTPEEKKFINSIVLNFPSSVRFPGHYIYRSYKYSCLTFEAVKGTLSTYDFIYTKGFSGWKLISEKKKGAIQSCKIGVNFHGYEMFQVAPEFKSKLQQFLLQSFVKKISREADVVFSYGGKITDIILSLGVAKNRIPEIPSGVEKDFIRSSISVSHDGVVKFVYLGRAERRKGIVELNEILKKLISEKLPFTFEFIGHIPDSMKINQDAVVYHGEIRDNKKIKEILSKCDVLVCPSWSEGFPNVILEAMACGLAVIATDVGAVSAMVSGKNGWLIEPGNQKELEDAFKQAMNSKDLDLKKENSLRLVQSEFNWDVISQKTIEAIQKIIL